MADVRPLRPPDDGGSDCKTRRDDRAQLMLVAALALAVLFVSLALLLNTVIYTGNLATRSVGGDSDAVAGYRTAAVDTADTSLKHANVHNNSDYPELETTFDTAVRDWDDATSRHRAVAGTATELNVTSKTRGTRLRQDNFSRSFENKSSNESWSVAEDIGGYRDFRMTVDRSTLTSIDGDEDNGTSLDAANVFHLTVETDASEEYTAFVGETDSSNVTVSVFGPSGHRATCTAPASDGNATIDVSNGTVGGNDCEALTFEDDVDGEVTLRYGDGDDVAGTYSLVVDTPYSEYEEDFVNAGNGSPYRTHALFDAELELVYRTPSTHYESTVVVPDA